LRAWVNLALTSKGVLARMSRDRLREVALVYWPVALAALIMIPRLLSAEFGLFDDGETLRVAEDIQNGDWGVLAKEAARGRFRPIYWIQYAHVYWLTGIQPTWFFLWNTLLFMTVTALTIHIVRRMGAGILQAATTGVLLVLAGPLVESTYTLSKPELLQVLLLLAAVTPFTRTIGDRRIRLFAALWATLLILVATLTKETAVIMVPISAAWLLAAIISKRREDRRGEAAQWGALLLASSAATLVYFALRSQFLEVSLSEGSYTNNLELSMARLIDSAVRWSGWLVRDFAWVAPLLLVPFLDVIDRKLKHGRLLLGAAIWTVAWILIYLPWEFMVEYYMLPVAIGVSIIGGIALDSTVTRIREKRRAAMAWLSLGLASILWLTTLPNNYSNVRQQLAVDAANARMLQYLVDRADDIGNVIVNIQHENEYVYEVRTYLQDVWDLDGSSVTIFNPGEGLDPGPLLIASPHVRHQPLLAVRMGVVENSQNDWNQSLAEALGSQTEVAFEWEESFRLALIDLPRLLCAVLPERGYCRSERPFVDTGEFNYGWKIYELPEGGRSAID
jgi:hypothetical protein